MHVLVTYHSRTENTRKLAEQIADGVRTVDDVDCVLKPVSEVAIDDILAADGLIAGSPSYYGTMASEMKGLFDRVITGHRDQTAGTVGAAFSTAGHPTGGLETTMVAILQSMLVAGFVVLGDPREAGGHYGVGCVGAPDERDSMWARLHGERIAKLVRRLHTA